MADHNDQSPFRHPLQFLPDQSAVSLIHPGEGFVQQIDRGLLQQGPGQKQAFPLAAAMTAMEQLSGLTSAAEGGISSFTAGDLTIRRETEKSLSAQAEGLLAPWLGDREFHFQGVAG